MRYPVSADRVPSYAEGSRIASSPHRQSSSLPALATNRPPERPGSPSDWPPYLGGVGSVGWSLAYGGRAHPPFPTFADIFWLLWYPLMALGLFRLVQSRLQKFSWHRWMDGVAVMLVVLTAGVALMIEPAVDAGVQGRWPASSTSSYPVLDVLMIGAIIGVYGLLGWRPTACGSSWRRDRDHGYRGFCIRCSRGRWSRHRYVLTPFCGRLGLYRLPTRRGCASLGFVRTRRYHGMRPVAHPATRPSFGGGYSALRLLRRNRSR